MLTRAWGLRPVYLKVAQRPSTLPKTVVPSRTDIALFRTHRGDLQLGTSKLSCTLLIRCAYTIPCFMTYQISLVMCGDLQRT